MSNKGLDVFGVTPGFEIDKAKEALEAKLNPSWIKQRQQGGATLSYIGGHTVIRLLNKAFNYQWSFEIVTEEVKQSVPKPAYDGWGKNKKAKLDAQGNQIFEPQPPVAKVLGRLTVPGLGVKEQYGSKVLVGGATEQESAFKSASTDALKKCASLFGIGLELYGEDEGIMDSDEHVAQNTPVPPQQSAPQQQQQTPQKEYNPPAQEQTPPPAQQQTPPAQQQQAPQQTASNAAGGWNQDDINRLKDLKGILGITDNTQLDPYVREFFDNPNVTWQNITPENIKAVNIFLAKKAETV
jgi:hypothetical protein